MRLFDYRWKKVFTFCTSTSFSKNSLIMGTTWNKFLWTGKCFYLFSSICLSNHVKCFAFHLSFWFILSCLSRVRQERLLLLSDAVVYGISEKVVYLQCLVCCRWFQTCWMLVLNTEKRSNKEHNKDQIKNMEGGGGWGAEITCLQNMQW